MKLFPTKEITFKLIDNQSETLGRLTRRTLKSTSLGSQITDKSFIGTIDDNQFKIISSVVGKGAFCVMTGIVEQEGGIVYVEIHKGFRVLLSILLLMPVMAFFLSIGKKEFSPVFIVVVVAQILMIRYLIIGIAFKYLAKQNLNRFRDVLDVEWIRS